MTSPDDPRCPVRSEKTGKTAAHRPDAIRPAGQPVLPSRPAGKRTPDPDSEM
ncbi:DUF2945 domain-containing protein [Amycolatopsis circi]|uniref:DUF2945 domain-containing protein n=1 Tax=Amycolatopsis circi TaxID=871959 RepID=UPI0013BE9FEA|nr:DUF2945 domain-containing protein [Amycolatopsis circi]